MKRYKCGVCRDVGFLVIRMYGSRYVPDGTVAVQRCDECQSLGSDVAAARIANHIGLRCRLKYPCIVWGIPGAKT